MAVTLSGCHSSGFSLHYAVSSSRSRAKAMGRRLMIKPPRSTSVPTISSSSVAPNDKLRLFSGSANRELSQEIAYHLGIEVGKIRIKMFNNEEIDDQLPENIEGCNVFLVQPTCPPVDDNLMELCTMIYACREGSAKKITAVIPYFGYARAYQQTIYGESAAGKLVSKLITRAGADSILACDLHSEHLMRFFDIPVENVYCQRVILNYLTSKSLCSNDLVVVSPDVGGVKRAQTFAKELSDAPLVVVDHSRRNVAKVINLIGDVRDKVAIMIDDIIDTADTMAKGADLLHKAGAREVYACSTHALLSPPAIERLSSGLFQEVITTNTIPIVAAKVFPELTVLSVANLLAGAIRRAHNDFS